jgi:hypothetical protein
MCFSPTNVFTATGTSASNGWTAALKEGNGNGALRFRLCDFMRAGVEHCVLWSVRSETCVTESGRLLARRNAHDVAHTTSDCRSGLRFAV